MQADQTGYSVANKGSKTFQENSEMITLHIFLRGSKSLLNMSKAYVQIRKAFLTNTLIFFSLFSKNGFSKNGYFEVHCLGASNEYSQCLFLWRSK